MAVIKVTRGGGLAGQSLTRVLDTRTVPDGDRLEKLVRRSGGSTRSGRRRIGAPDRDQFVYTIEVDGDRLVAAETDLTEELAALVKRVLGSL